VIGHPSTPGGLRLRYGRARNHGFATAGIHPATMHLTDDFLATGTQIKTERPGKAAGIIPVDTIEGPTVRLADGSVIRIDDPTTARELRTGVDEVLDLGEYLVNIGEFIENNQPLAPAGWAVEWWVQLFAAAGAPIQALTDDPHVSLSQPSPTQALEWATAYDAPLHPIYTYLWHDISVAELELLVRVVEQGQLTDAPALPAVFDHSGTALQLPRGEGVAGILERLLVEHHQGPELLTIPTWRPLVRTLGFDASLEHAGVSVSAAAQAYAEGTNAIQAVNELAPFSIRERAPTRVGVRMGRPEKSERRQLDPPVHVLYPLDDRGGNQRDIVEAAAATEASIDAGVPIAVGTRECPQCAAATYHMQCPDCGDRTTPVTACLTCGHPGRTDPSGRRVCPNCERRIDGVQSQPVTVARDLRDALARVDERPTSFEILKGVRGLSSAAKTPEPLEKGILRAKHDVSVFKDGTVRYDMTDLPVTAVRPSELDMTAAGFQALGYSHAIDGEPLQFDDQLVELRTQDIILSDGAAEYLMRTADFVDDLLVRFYGMAPFYEVDTRADLVGELVFGMAPHTSAAVVGRIVGFTSAAVGYAHPFFHAAKRRNCDGDEDCVMLLMDGLLNFSRSYLPDRRGGSMDAPLVMSSRIDPTEIDDEAHNIDVMPQYPLSVYEATRRCAPPDAVVDALALAGDAIAADDELQFAHTHDTADIAAGPALSAYKTLGSMMDKTDAQLELARKLRAVDATDVAERVIEGHFLPDLIGNLRAFASQESRCIDCERKYRRMPLSGSCRECGGRVTLTVHQGSVRKYLEPAMHVAEAYGCRPYTTQRLEVLAATIDSVFENDHNRQSGIADFM
jgi:Archaeal DNA polymerase II, large subunit